MFDDLKEAERWTGIQGKVDMAELTWEQRERVLRMLFAKMNGFKEKRRYVVFLICFFERLFSFRLDLFPKCVFGKREMNVIEKVYNVLILLLPLENSLRNPI